MSQDPETLADRLSQLEEALDELRETIAREGGPLARLLLRALGLRARTPAAKLASRVAYDEATVDRVLELGLRADLQDPKAFLERCTSTNLDPIAVLEWRIRDQARRG